MGQWRRLPWVPEVACGGGWRSEGGFLGWWGYGMGQYSGGGDVGGGSLRSGNGKIGRRSQCLMFDAVVVAELVF